MSTRTKGPSVRDSIPRPRQKQLEELSPFELKNQLIALADENRKRSDAIMLNAGRGNPNWVATEAREAFFLLGKFALAESVRTSGEGRGGGWGEGIGGMPVKDGIAGRLAKFLGKNSHERGADLLRRSAEYASGTLGMGGDAFVYELTDAITGDNYPVPDRMLTCIEKVVHAYLVQEMCEGEAPAKPYDLFATEGGTAAMCYLFDSLQVNKILNRGDKVAVMVPIFTPYLEIPRLDRYAFDVVEIHADENSDWQYPDSELEKLADPSVKALYLVNPSNPPSVMMANESIDTLVSIVEKKNPGLVIITDDVYGTFVNGFRSLMSVLPRNTIGVYSFSKYFGCTGWRLGVIAVNEDNIFDPAIAQLPAAGKKTLAKRYSSITLEPEKLKFIDRMVADSRDVALNHTAGLSCPQQAQMALFALAALLDTENQYKQVCQSIIGRRMHSLAKGMLVPLPRDPNAAHYYVELDILSFLEKQWGKGFADYMRDNYEPVDLLFRLAENHSIVLLNGGGFDGPPWSVRVSMANLPMADYGKICSWLAEEVREYKAEFDAQHAQS